MQELSVLRYSGWWWGEFLEGVSLFNPDLWSEKNGLVWVTICLVEILSTYGRIPLPHLQISFWQDVADFSGANITDLGNGS